MAVVTEMVTMVAVAMAAVTAVVMAVASDGEDVVAGCRM